MMSMRASLFFFSVFGQTEIIRFNPFNSRMIKDGVLQGGSIFWVCGWNPMVWPFKWNLFGSTLT